VRFNGGGVRKELGKEDFWRVLCGGVRIEFSDSTFETYERR
jgi:hypothetical protein